MRFVPRALLLSIVAAPLLLGAQAPARSGNPILPGWYADPEVHYWEGEYWIYPTYSAPYNEQVFLDAFSSRDLITWVKHPRIIDTASVKWAKRAMWAPSIIEKDGWYYLFFGANDIQNDQQVGGIGVARSRNPEGPFQDWIGKPLIGAFHNGAQPIDQNVFRDINGDYYIVYGGWKHCNIAKLRDDFAGLDTLPDGSNFKEITPSGYVEGAFMLVKDGKYYFMWSEGGWTGPNYAVAYAVGKSPFGPFERVGKILQQDSTVATGAGHHSVVQSPTGKWYIVYHRRPLGETDRNHRVVSIDELHFDDKGMILPVKITKGGVAEDPVPMNAHPPLPYHSRESCPGEGSCAWGKKWLVCAPLVVRKEPKPDAPIVGRLGREEWIVASTGDWVVYKPGLLTFSDTARMGSSEEVGRSQPFTSRNSTLMSPRDTVFLLDPLGEGYWNAMQDGQDVRFYLPGDSRSRVRDGPVRYSPPVSSWWISLKSEKLSGWADIDGPSPKVIGIDSSDSPPEHCY